jgi:hypothetical protein
MSIRADSYSSISEVTAFIRHLIKGQTNLNSTTRPTLADTEEFIDRASGVLNNALAASGFAPSSVIANSTARLACDDWVTMRAVDYAELTQRGTGYSTEDGSRINAFRSLYGSATEFVEGLRPGLINLGVSQANKKSDGLIYTGIGVQNQRSDPKDTTLEQPMFERNQFDVDSDY